MSVAPAGVRIAAATVAAALNRRRRRNGEDGRDAEGEDLNEAIHNQPGYYGIKALSTLNHRYIFEDVPMSLVPIGVGATLAYRSAAGFDHPPAPIHRTTIGVGRTLESWGLTV
jgi:opine dehydrogenase